MDTSTALEASSKASLALPSARYAALLLPKRVKSSGRPAIAWLYDSAAFWYSPRLK